MLNFKSFWSASSVLAGIELIYMIQDSQFAVGYAVPVSFADQFYALAGHVCTI